MVDYCKFRSSPKHLDEQNRNELRGIPNRPKLDNEAVAESVIKRFETSYDRVWKLLKRYLAEVLGVANAPNSPKPVIQ